MKVYRDGNALECRNDVNNIKLGASYHPYLRANSFIGKSNWGSDWLFKGFIEELRIYRSEFTAADAKSAASWKSDTRAAYKS